MAAVLSCSPWCLKRSFVKFDLLGMTHCIRLFLPLLSTLHVVICMQNSSLSENVKFWDQWASEQEAIHDIDVVTNHFFRSLAIIKYSSEVTFSVRFEMQREEVNNLLWLSRTNARRPPKMVKTVSKLPLIRNTVQMIPSKTHQEKTYNFLYETVGLIHL